MTPLDALFGRRVSLRHRIGERDGRALYSDAVGDLEPAGDDDVVVRTRRGRVTVARAAVVAVRAVPPPVPRRASWAAVARLESLCADAWPARADVALGAWRLRAAGGFTARANGALAVGDPGRPVPAALAAVGAFAAEHGIAPRVQVPVGSPWDRAVAAEGWVLDAGHEAGAEVAVLVADLDRLAEFADEREPRVDLPDEPPVRTGHVALAGRAGPGWWEVALGRAPTAVEAGVLDPGPPLRTGFGLVPGVAAARAALVEDHLHLSRLTVVPASRRQGLGRALTAAAAAWGRERGARWAVLQVALHNTAARAFYANLGCTEHHRYRYLVPRPASHRSP